jgi:hypothetical protein
MHSVDVIVPVGKFVLRALAALLAAFAIVLAAGVLRLSSGPLSLAFLSPYLSDALSYSNAGVSAEVEDTVLAWGDFDHTLALRAVGVRLTRKDGTPIAFIPQMSMHLSIAGLLRGRIAPTSFEIIGGKALVRRNPDGRFDFGIVDSGGGTSSDLVTLIVDELSRSDGGGIAAYLTHVALVDGELTIEDRKLGAVWQVPRATLALWREPGGVRGDAALNVRLGSRLAKISAAGHYLVASSTANLRVAFENLEPALFADVAPPLAELKAVQLPLSGSVEFNVGSDGHFAAVKFALVGNSGTLDLRPHVDMPPLAFRSLVLRGGLADDFGGVTLDEGRFDLGELRGEAHGSVGFSPAGPALDLVAVIDGFPTASLERYWPADVAKNAREWIVANIKGGVVRDVNLTAKLTPEMIASGDIPPSAMALDFHVGGASVVYLRPLPPVEGIVAAGHLTGKFLELQVDQGHSGDLEISEGQVKITEFDKFDQIANISLVISGAAGSALGLLDHKPLGFAAKVGIDPAKVSGQSATRARFIFPLRHDLKLDDLQVAAASNLRDIAIPGIFDRYLLSGGDLTLRVDKQRMEVTGKASLQGVSAQIVWREEFAPAPGQFASHYKVSGTVDDAGRSALGYPMDPYVSGPINAELAIDTGRKGDFHLEGRLDLRPAKVDISELHWTKPVGNAGSLDLALDAPAGGPVQLSRLALKSGDFSAEGEAEIAGGKLSRLAVPHVAFGKTDIGVDMTRAADGGMQLVVRGKSFDFRPYLDDLLGPETKSEKPAPPLDLEAAFEHMIVGDGVEVAGFAGTGHRREDRWQDFNAIGKLGGKTPIEFHMAPDGKRRSVAVTSGDAGQVVKAIGISDDTVGGKFDLKGQIEDDQPDQPIRGRLRIDDFKVVHAPVLAKLLTVASLTGIVDLLSGDGIGFIRADVPFHTRGGKLHIDNARAWGAAIGITASGTLDRGRDTLALNGTVVPAYSINRILGAIPLLGNILVGREGEGIIGITYSVSGTSADPQVSVNPLSALAPGILRRMFEPSASGDESGQTETPAAPTASGDPANAPSAK